MKNTNSKKKQNLRRSNILEIVAVFFILIFVNVISSYIFTRIDLTSEKRFTLDKHTKEMLRNLDDQVVFRVYLEGDDLSAEYRHFHNEIKDMLDQFRAYSKHVEYEFVNPNDLAKTAAEKNRLYSDFQKKGIMPMLDDDAEGGVVKQQVVVPAMEVKYKGRETAQQLQVPDETNRTEAINASIENLEYNFVRAINRLQHAAPTRIGFLLGHGELEKVDLLDIQLSLVEDYAVENVYLDRDIAALTEHTQDVRDSSVYVTNKFKVLIVPKPRQAFSDQDLFVLDQYVMHGGKVLWLVDALDADMDSLQNQPQTFATRMPTNLDEMFFNYGVRVNANLIMDYRCRPIPMKGGDNRNVLVPWYYFPTLVPNSDHPIVKNLDVLKTDFISSIDLIDNNDGITKTVLLTTSDHVHVKNAPVIVQLNDAMLQLNDQIFNRANLPVAVLLEGRFKSIFRSRLTSDFAQRPEIGYLDECKEPTSMIIVSDGDMIRNEWTDSERGLYPYPLGYDHHINTKFANKKFILNSIYYLAGDENLIYAGSRNITIRPLNKSLVEQKSTYYQFVTMCYPVLMVLVIAVVVFFVRRYRYHVKTV